ncbi:DNA-binding MarR family transcriptional regulator [Amycolatopsis viridis]|uniref:DNA-binding MarR family transcriptional regulator n=1 Tax=Amycolatopsis viridis TaxID=185678 RepID=A0ABX0SU73_9PSEU|nr:DNA-binding MarR family transcriptional regulator [Amycolatopsis viridis]
MRVVEQGEISRGIAAVARAHLAVAGRLLRECGLYPGQELLLMRLWENDHRSQTELARALDLDLSTVSRTVQALERNGFVVRGSSQTDRRSVIVSLTPAGRGLRPAVERMWAALDTATTAGLSDRQQADLLRLLRRVERNLLDADSASAGT